MNTITQLTVAAICGLALTACGGGGGDDTSAPASNPGGNGNTVTNPTNPGSSGSSSTGSTGNGSTSGGTSGDQTATYTVTPSVSGSSGGGTINPSIAVSVKSGAATSFQITPSAGYTTTVGGTCGGTLTGTTYTTQPITASCTVVATFAVSVNAVTLRYEPQWLASRDIDVRGQSFLNMLNQEGAKGYRYLISWVGPRPAGYVTTGSDIPDAYIFVNDGAAPSYTYELLPNPLNTTDFLAQINAQGALGYRYQQDIQKMMYGNEGCILGVSPNCLGTLLYRKVGGSSATYSYTTGPMPTSVADFLTKVNGQGQAGYRFYGFIGYFDTTVPASSQAMLYEKNNSAASATYAYEAPVLPSVPDMLLAQYNSEGARGYLATSWETLAGLGLDPTAFGVYVHDQTPTVYTYQSGPAAGLDITSLISQLNSYGAQGYAFYNGVYVKASSWSSGTPSPALDWPPQH
jgi:hypothetical protein